MSYFPAQRKPQQQFMNGPYRGMRGLGDDSSMGAGPMPPGGNDANARINDMLGFEGAFNPLSMPNASASGPMQQPRPEMRGPTLSQLQPPTAQPQQQQQPPPMHFNMGRGAQQPIRRSSPFAQGPQYKPGPQGQFNPMQNAMAQQLRKR
jgi:hypothetical protein